MCTYKSTCIANFVAKLAYIHVACNTYIPKVYIRLLSYGITAVKKNACSGNHCCYPIPTARANSGIKIQEIGFSEMQFMKYNSVILNHESKFSN